MKELNSIWYREETSGKGKYNVYHSIINSILLYEAVGRWIMEIEIKEISDNESRCRKKILQVLNNIKKKKWKNENKGNHIGLYKKHN